MTRRWWLAPALDLVCIVTFILVGAGRHNINEGADWFLLVFWPIAVGWYGVALLAKLYTAPDRIKLDKWIDESKKEHYRKYGERL